MTLELRSCRRTQAFTLLEMLIAIAVLGMMMILTTSAVQKVRESASKMRCQDNLRQIGLGLHQYHAQRDRLPGGVTPYDPSDPFGVTMPWHLQVLPYVGEESLWNLSEAAWQSDRSSFTDPGHVGLRTVLTSYICPKEARTHHPLTKAAYTSYMGVSGTLSPLGDGMLFFDSAIRFVDVRDGLSNTLLVGERPPSPPNEDYGRWYGGWGQYQGGHARSFLGVTDMNLDIMNGCMIDQYQFGPGDANNLCDTFHFWSHHPNGANFLFADGSVRFLRYAVVPVMSALATRSGGDIAALE